jgi:beta-glucosidase-like glycosyl hydrolase
MEIKRIDIGFDGLIMTYDISMKALSGDLGTLSHALHRSGL